MSALLWVLRDQLNLTGTKYGCGMGLCGAANAIFAACGRCLRRMPFQLPAA